MIANQHGVDAHSQVAQEPDRPVDGRIRQMLKMTVVGLLISLAYVAWVALAVFSTFDLA